MNITEHNKTTQLFPEETNPSSLPPRPPYRRTRNPLLTGLPTRLRTSISCCTRRLFLPSLGAIVLGPPSDSSRYTVVPSCRSRGCAFLCSRAAAVRFVVFVKAFVAVAERFRGCAPSSLSSLSSLSSSLSESKNSSGSSFDAGADFCAAAFASACSSSRLAASSAASASAFICAAASSRALRASACALSRASFSCRLRFSSAARLFSDC